MGVNSDDTEHVDQAELLKRLNCEYEHLQTTLAQLTPDERVSPQVIGEWSVKDILAHLIAHEQRALEELWSAQMGKHFVIDHGATDRFNAEAVLTHQRESYEEVVAAWEDSFQAVIAMVESLSAEDFVPTSAVVKGLDDSIDGALGNNTYKHYAEHRCEIARWKQGY